MVHVLTTFLFVLFFSCDKKDTGFNNETYDTIYNQAKVVISSKCTSCHKDYQYFSKNDWSRKGLITPGSSEHSPLFRSLVHSNTSGKSNMPPDKNITPAEVSAIKLWINHFTIEQELQKTSNEVIAKGQYNDLEIYRKCYSLLSQSPLKSLNKEQAARIIKRGGTLSCQNLLKTTTLEFSQKKPSINAQNIISNMHSLHFSWFPSLHLYNIMDTWSTYDLYDIDQEALYITRSLFNNKFNFLSIFEGENILKTKRISSTPKNEQFTVETSDEHFKFNILNSEFIQGSEDGLNKIWSPENISRGKLIDIKSTEKSDYSNLDYYVTSLLFPKTYKKTVPLIWNDGGGILGLSTSLLFNFGRNLGERMDGARILPRRWTKNIIKNILCRDLPVITFEDAKSFVNNNSKISFNQKESCQTCHATMDNLAAMHRNKELVLSTDKADFQTLHLLPHNINRKHKLKIGEGRNDFYKSDNDGIFVYRDIFGKFYQHNVRNFKELGSLISDIPDAYYCISSKYFRYFTGFSFDIEKVTKKTRINSHYKEFIQITNRFMIHKKLDLLIFDIFDSKLFWGKNFEITQKNK